MTARSTPTTPAQDPATVAGDRYLSLEEAAAMTGRHPESIRRWIRDGDVEARKDTTRRGRPYEVLERSLLAKVGKAEVAPAGGGIFDPKWGPFTRDPFRRE